MDVLLGAQLSTKPNIPMVFGSALETTEVLSKYWATLGPGKEEHIYEIPVPRDYEGQQMLGWLLLLKQFQGSGLMLKVFSQEGESILEVKVTDQNTLVLAPPWWRLDCTGYLSVKASTNF